MLLKRTRPVNLMNQNILKIHLYMIVVDDDGVFNSHFPFMAKLNDDKDEEVTLLDIKQNLDKYSLKKLKGLANV